MDDDRVDLTVRRPTAWNGAVRKIQIIAPDGTKTVLRSGESCRVTMAAELGEVIAKSGPSKATWRGSVTEGLVLEVGFRGIFEAAMRFSEIYITEAS